jgi:amino acid transporter
VVTQNQAVAGESGSGGQAIVITTDLKKDAIGLGGVLMQSLTGMGPSLAALFFTQEVVGIAGVTSPLAYLFGVLIVLMLGSTLAQLVKHMPSAGSYYTFVSRGLNPRLGFLTGWMTAMYMPFNMGPILGYFGFILANELRGNYGIQVSFLWWLFVLVGAVVIAVLAHYGIALSIRVMVFFGLAEITLVWLLGLWGLFSPGRGGFNFSSFDPSKITGISAFALAIAFSFQGMDGWEFAAPLAEETRNPRRNVPRAVMIAITGLGATLVIAYWGQVVGWGTSNLHSLATSVELPGLVLAHRYWGGGWVLMLIALFTSTFACCQALNNVSTRMSYRMACSGSAPKWLSKVDPVHKTPTNAIMLQLVLTIGTGIGVGLALGPANSFFLIVGLLVVLTVVYVYVMANAAVARYYWREHRDEFNPIRHIFFPVFTSAALIYVVIKTFQPMPAYPLNLAPYIGGAWLLVGIILLFVMKWRGHEDWLRTAGEALGGVVPTAGEALHDVTPELISTDAVEGTFDAPPAY